MGNDVSGAAEPLGLVLGIMCVFFIVGTLGYFLMHLKGVIAAVRSGAIVATPLVPILAAAGAGVALYLAYVRLSGTAPICGPLVDCDVIQKSEYADVMGVPIAFLGVLANVACILLWWRQRRIRSPWVTAVMFLTAAAGTIYSLYLTSLQLFIVHAVCPWCLLSAMLFTGTVATIGIRLLDQAPRPQQYGS
jgi:uncharacterized membrane protein